MKRQTKRPIHETQRKLHFETLQPRELLYAPTSTPMVTPDSDCKPPVVVAQPIKTKPATIDLNLLPQGSAFKSNRYVPDPITVFPNGSVHTISPEISPRVVELMQKNNTGPVRTTLHRTGVGYGAPTNTLAGMNPKLRELTTMKENWAQASGKVTRSIQRIEISPENLAPNVDIDAIYSWLEDFRLFDKGNIATVKVYNPSPLDLPLPDGESYAVFTVNTLDISNEQDPYWEMLNTIQRMVNGRDMVIKLHSDPAHHQLAAVTLENHMLVGVRVWRVYESHKKWVCIETESHEQRNGFINNLAAQIAARSAMEEVWHRYLTNIGKAATGGTQRYAELPAQWLELPQGRDNPWRNLKSIPAPQKNLPLHDFPIRWPNLENER